MFALLSTVLVSPSLAVDWLTLPGTFSHDPVSGNRVAQFAPIEPPTAPVAQNFRSSGYTHTRSGLRYGPSVDNYHRVETWGDPVRPYGEWQFPFRPYSSPYPYWGTPFGGLTPGPGFGSGGFGPGGYRAGPGSYRAGPGFGAPWRGGRHHRDGRPPGRGRDRGPRPQQPDPIDNP